MGDMLVFRMYDKNNDGFIDFREFMIILYVMSTGAPEEKLKQIFRIFDLNSDGVLSQDEISKIIKDFCKLHDHELKATMAIQEMKPYMHADKGLVTEEVFIKACLNGETITEMLTVKIIDLIYDVSECFAFKQASKD